jgi:hypothetical protein
MESWKADGWALESVGVRGWEYRSGTDGVAAPVGVNGSVPNRRGEIWRPKTLGPGMFTLGMWLAGPTREDAEAQFFDLLRACVRPHRQVKFERTRANGVTYECYAEYAGQINPTPIAQRGIRAAIDFKVADGVWRGQTLVTTPSPADATLPKTLALPGLAASTAAIEDGSFTVAGPISNTLVVDVTDGVDGDSFSYTKPIASGESITVNSQTWDVTGGGGHVVDLSKVFPAGRRMLTVVAARPGAQPTFQLRGTGGGALTRLTYAAYPTFAC